MTNNKSEITGLALLREPFPHHHISKLPKPTKSQTEAVRTDYKAGIRCKVCGQWHHKDVVHLDYVGHAALTHRLLDVDPAYVCEPMAYDSNGLPAFDNNGGLWVRLTILGVTRMGYGDAEGKKGGNAVKEAIGDAMRNAAMRFGAALDLWHKGDLHIDEDDTNETPKDEVTRSNELLDLLAGLEGADTTSSLKKWLDSYAKSIRTELTSDERMIFDAAYTSRKQGLILLETANT